MVADEVAEGIEAGVELVSTGLFGGSPGFEGVSSCDFSLTMDSRKGGDAGLTGSAGGFVTSGTDVVVTWGAEKGDARGLFVASVGSVPSLSIDKNAFSTLFSPKAETPAAAKPPNPPKPRGLGTASVDGGAGLAAKLPNPPVMLAKPAAGVVGAVGLPKAIGTEGCPNADPLELVGVIGDC